MPGSIVFRWYDRTQADEIYSAWTVGRALERLEADKAKTGAPLGKPGIATTESLEHLLADMRARGLGETPIRQLPQEQASDPLLRYELICDACTQAEWRAKEPFFIRHITGLRMDAGQEISSAGARAAGESAGTRFPQAPAAVGAAYLAPADLEEQYQASREGRFRWRDWPALVEAMERLEWNRWTKTFRASYEADKVTRKAGVERALRENYTAVEELGRRLQEGEQHDWALVIYDANDERLPFPTPAFLMEAVRQTEAEVAEARRAAEVTMARRRRFQRIVVPIVLVGLFLMLSFLFTRSIVGGLVGTALIVLIIATVVYFIIRPQART